MSYVNWINLRRKYFCAAQINWKLFKVNELKSQLWICCVLRAYVTERRNSVWFIFVIAKMWGNEVHRSKIDIKKNRRKILCNRKDSQCFFLSLSLNISLHWVRKQRLTTINDEHIRDIKKHRMIASLLWTIFKKCPIQPPKRAVWKVSKVNLRISTVWNHWIYQQRCRINIENLHRVFYLNDHRHRSICQFIVPLPMWPVIIITIIIINLKEYLRQSNRHHHGQHRQRRRSLEQIISPCPMSIQNKMKIRQNHHRLAIYGDTII